MARARWYRVVVKTKKGRRITMAPGPLTHDEAVTILRKLTPRANRQEMVEEIRGGYRALHAQELRERRR